MEALPKKPGSKLARFYENAKAYSRTVDGVKEKGWEWDEYHTEFADYPGLEADVAANAAAFLKAAREKEEADNIVETLTEENRLLKAQVDAQSDQLDFYEDCIAEMAEIIYA